MIRLIERRLGWPLRAASRLLFVLALAACTAPIKEPVQPSRSPSSSASAPTPDAAPVDVPESSACLERFDVLHSDSLLQEQRVKGPHAPDFQEVFLAEEIGPSHLAVEATARTTASGSPVFWFTPDRRTAVVDARFFTKLVAVDPLRFAPGRSEAVGKVLVGREILPGRDVAKLLIAAGVVHVYWHVEADVCLLDERIDDGEYSLRIRGAHTYYTNGKNTDPFDFWLRISKDGEITVSRPR